MAFVDDEERVRWEVVEQRRRRLAWLTARQVPRVILNPVAVTNLLNHLEVEHRPLMQTMRFEDLPLGFKLRAIPVQLRLDAFNRRLGAIARGHEVSLRIDGDLV